MPASRPALIFAAIFALAPPVFAQSPTPKSDWSLRLGAAALVVPSYEGSKNLAVRPLPLVDLSWRDTVFLDTRRGLGANLVKFGDAKAGGAFKIGPIANWRFQRNEDDDDDLKGLGDVKGGVDVGAFVQYAVGPFDLNLVGKRNVSQSNLGGTVEFGANYRFAPIGSLRASIGPTATWADSDYMKSYFGVAADKVAASRLSAYAPSSGMKDVGFGASLAYPLGANWTVGGFAGYKRLLGDAADSPLVKERGQANQFSLGWSVSYKLY